MTPFIIDGVLRLGLCCAPPMFVEEFYKAWFRVVYFPFKLLAFSLDVNGALVLVTMYRPATRKRDRLCGVSVYTSMIALTRNPSFSTLNDVRVTYS